MCSHGEEMKEDSGIGKAPPTLESTLPSSPLTLPAIHAAIYNPNLTVDEVEVMVTAHPLCLESVEPRFGYTPLHCAAKRCSMPLISMLVHHGAIVDTRAARGETSLMVASESGSLYVVHTLCECGADSSLVDSHGQSALHYAAKAGAVHILHYLSERGGLDFRATDNQGNTPLHLAAWHLKLETIEYLMRHERCEVAATNQDGLTALHYATKHGSIEMCWILLNQEQNIVTKLLHQREKNGLSPLDIARKGHKQKHNLLSKKLDQWSDSPGYMRLYPWGWWVFFSLLGGLTMTLALLAITQLFQPVGFVLSLVILLLGFFLPLSMHRIPHPAGWPNPQMVGALVAGVTLTTFNYFKRVFHVVWPDYYLSFIIMAIIGFTALVIYFKLRRSDPGFDKIGKLSSDGKPFTIVDVARQAETSPHGFAYMEGKDLSGDTLLFCTKCEIVIPEYTKHCKLCQGCCRGFDHHCTWLSSCIGYKNHRLFIIFVFSLMIDNFLYVYHAFAMMLRLGGDNGFWGVLSVSFNDESAAMLLLLCNLLTGLYAAANLWEQIMHISRRETGYFDSNGKAPYKKKRYGPGYSVITRVRLVILFFTDYPNWSRSSSKKLTLTV